MLKSMEIPRLVNVEINGNSKFS